MIDTTLSFTVPSGMTADDGNFSAARAHQAGQLVLFENTDLQELTRRSPALFIHNPYPMMVASAPVRTLRYRFGALSVRWVPPRPVAEGLLSGLGTDLYATCCCVWLDLASGTATTATAGHPSPLIVDADGNGVTESLPVGVPLGVDAQARYEQSEVQVVAGPVMALFTDGPLDGRLLGSDAAMERLGRVLADHCGDNLEVLAGRLVQDRRGWQVLADLATRADPDACGRRVVRGGDRLPEIADREERIGPGWCAQGEGVPTCRGYGRQFRRMTGR
ncbi:SpoIIE family protein phosphatase [Streptomyces sp. 900116325]